MSDKLNFSAASFITLRNYSLLTLEGPDAVAFIQAQSMNDVKALADGQWHWNGLLNPKGRMIALFVLLRIRADLLYLLSPDFPAEKLESHLRRFIFRSKVKTVLATDLVFAAQFNTDDLSTLPLDFMTGDAQHGIFLDFSSDTSKRRLCLIPQALATGILPDDKLEALWRDTDIEHGLPRLSQSQSELWTPQMLGLERLNAFSLKKGCYPGQEIVARTHYLGQAKRQTRLVRGRNLLVEAVVYRGEEKVGDLICSSSNAETGLALLQSVSDSDLLSCCQNEVKHSQPLTGLQRPI